MRDKCVDISLKVINEMTILDASLINRKCISVLREYP